MQRAAPETSTDGHWISRYKPNHLSCERRHRLVRKTDLKMPIDINMLRVERGGDPEKVRESQRRRFASVELVDEVISIDEKWRRLTGDIDNLKKQKNATQKQVAVKKKAKEDCPELVTEVKNIGEKIKQTEEEQAGLKTILDAKLGKIGNIVGENVPIFQDEDHNRVERSWGTPRDPVGLLNHHDLLWRIGGYEPDRGVAVAGHRGYFLKDMGVLLNQAFINYGIAFLRKRNYSILQPPYMMKKSMMAGVAQLEEFDEALYKVSGGANDSEDSDKYLIATSEQPICGYHKGEWLDEKSLPLRYSGVSSCFRKEAGKHGKDVWGIFRVHQFEKVEQFVICEDDIEVSNAIQQEMLVAAEEFYQSLGFPYQVINIVSGALNNAAIRKYDLECWFPGYNEYKELVSCSNCTDYQSRAMEIRCGATKKMNETTKKYVHMLNSTLCATGRAICCLLETYQEENGVRVPEVLQPYMGGISFMPFIREARGEKDGDAKSSSKSSAPKELEEPKVSSPNPAPVSAPIQESPEVAALNAEISKKGSEIRELKAAKTEKAVLQPYIDELVALKDKLRIATGASVSSPKEEKKKKTSSAPSQTTVAVVKEAIKVGLPPNPPILAPKYTTPAPESRKGGVFGAALRAQPSLSWTTSSDDNNVNVNLSSLETLLKDYSYVGGYAPSIEDSKALNNLYENGTGLPADTDSIRAWISDDPYMDYPNIRRWLKNVSCFDDDEKNNWS